MTQPVNVLQIDEPSIHIPRIIGRSPNPFKRPSLTGQKG